MTLLEEIAATVAGFAGDLSESVSFCSFIMCIFSVGSLICIRHIVSGLFEMHRSKSSLKKILKTYTFGQKLCLKHAWQDCLHAKRFCRRLIVVHHGIFFLTVLELMLALLCNLWPVFSTVIAWYTIVFMVVIAFPIFLLDSSLDRYPFQKWKHEFIFRKYHNTDDHENLW